MDVKRLWDNVVELVAQQCRDEKQAKVIQLLGTQVSLALRDNVVAFTCQSKYAQETFSLYVPQFFDEIKRQLQRSDLTLAMGVAGGGPVGGSGPAPAARPAKTTPEQEFTKYFKQSDINPDKTFDNYVTDPENLVIVNIARKVASVPGSSSTNPLYIYGGSGLGKTHLLFAIANYIKRHRPEISVVYTRAEEFIRNYVESMSAKGFDYRQVHFQDLYTRQDVFIVDDIQNFIKGEKARDTFFSIIAEFLEKPNRQLVLASDVPPGRLESFSVRLTSRFGSGICSEIYPPNQETREAITIRKCREFKVELSEAIIQYIAAHFRSNVREIEGAIKTLNTYITTYGAISYDQAVQSLANLLNTGSQATTIDQIKERVAKEFGVTTASMESAERKKAVSQARSFAMTLAQDLITDLSLNDIGRSFNKDHSSVHEAIRRTRERMQADAHTKQTYQNLLKSLRR